MGSYRDLPCGSVYIPKRNAYCFRCGKNLKGREAVVNLMGIKSFWKRLTCKGCVKSEDRKRWAMWNRGERK